MNTVVGPVLFSYEHLGLWCAIRHIVMFAEGMYTRTVPKGVYFAPYLAREHHRNILSLDKKRQRAFVHPVKIHVPIGTVIDGVIPSSFVARHQQSIQRDTDES